MSVPSSNMMNRSTPWISCLLAVLLAFVVYLEACPTNECYCFGAGEIDCSDMDLRRVPYFYQDNKTYYEIDLGRNKLKRLGGYVFKDLNVRQVKIVQNKREMTLHARAFRGLENVVQLIRLKRNHLKEIPYGLFNGLAKLKVIDLSGNELQTLDKGIFRRARSVMSLSLMDNHIHELSSNVFLGLTNLKDLRLANNEIAMVDSKAFQSLRSLEKMDLKNNLIRDLQPRSFKRLKKLKSLDLSDNEIPALFPLMFKGLERLEKLILTNNPIIMVAADSFASMKNLKNLELSKAKMTYLKPTMFNGLEHLQELYLDKNNIKVLQDSVFASMRALTKINLDNNDLDTINACAFHDVKQMSDIWLYDNPINCDCTQKWTAFPDTPKVYGQCSTPEAVRGEEITKKEKYIVCRLSGLECSENDRNGLMSINDVHSQWRLYWRKKRYSPP